MIAQSRYAVRILNICEQFALDAAVLIFVFPVLDSVIQFGRKAVTGELLAWVLSLAGVSFALALLFGAASERLSSPKDEVSAS